MEKLISAIIIFIICLIVIELLIYAVKNARSPNRGKIRKRLRKYAYVEEGVGGADIMRTRILSEIPFVNRVLLKIPGLQKLDILLDSMFCWQSLWQH
jgi:tight adherence protein B